MKHAKLFRSYLGRLVFLFSIISITLSIRLAEATPCSTVPNDYFSPDCVGFAEEIHTNDNIFVIGNYSDPLSGITITGIMITLGNTIPDTHEAVFDPNNSGTVAEQTFMMGVTGISVDSLDVTNPPNYTIPVGTFQGISNATNADVGLDSSTDTISEIFSSPVTIGLRTLYRVVAWNFIDFEPEEIWGVRIDYDRWTGLAFSNSAAGSDLNGTKVKVTFSDGSVLNFPYANTNDSSMKRSFPGNGIGEEIDGGTGGAVPEPGMAFMLLTFVAGLAGYRRFLA